MTDFYTADSHFNHNNVLSFENRPFESKQEMDSTILNQWNSQATEADIIYHLGDFAFASFSKTVEYLERIRAQIVIVGGNHDEDKIWSRIMTERPELVKEFIPVAYKEQWGKEWVWFSHFPMEIGLRPDKWNLHGHIHGNESTYLNQINVGVDSPHFKHLPNFGQLLTKQDILGVMETRKQSITSYTHK